MNEVFAISKCAKTKSCTKKMKCPKCGRRAFDISDFPKEEIEVELKCPQCQNFVTVPCTKASELVTA